MTHHTKPLLRMIERIQGHQRDYPASDTFAPVRAQYTPDQWQALGGDEPAYLADLHTGEHLDRWLDQLSVYDRLLYWAVWAVVIGGGVTSLGLILLGNAQ